MNFQKNKLLLLILLLIVMGSRRGVHVYAQNLNISDFQNPAATAPGFTAGKADAVFIRQVGELNRVHTQQIGNQSVATPNLVRVMQAGALHEAQVNQTGVGNRTDVLQHNGNGNRVVSNVSGNVNASLLVQNGSGNTIQQQLLHSHHNQIQLTQNGSNNLIQQNFLHRSHQNLNITQNGNGLRLTIQQGN